MRLGKLAVILFLVLAIGFSCAPPKEASLPEVDANRVREEIEQANLRWEEAAQNQDAAAAAALYTADAMLLPPGGNIVQGTEGVQEFWGALFGMGLKTADLTTVELEVSGDMAAEVGEAILNLEPEGGEPMTQSFKYVVVWKNDGGTWKLHRDIWNANPTEEEGT